MAQNTVSFSEHFKATPAQVFPYFANHATFGAMAGGPVAAKLKFIRRIRLGENLKQPDGVGSVRRIGYGPLGFEETVRTSEPGKLIEYFISKGSPLKNHFGRIEFHADGKGTRVDYTITFEPKVPGTGGVLKGVLNSMIAPAFGRIRKALASA
jgi:hypothetical protein